MVVRRRRRISRPETGVDLQIITAARSALIPTSLHSTTVGAVGRRSTLRGAPRHESKQVLNNVLLSAPGEVGLEGGRCISEVGSANDEASLFVPRLGPEARQSHEESVAFGKDGEEPETSDRKSVV